MKLCMMSSVLGFDTPLEVVETAVFCDMEAVDWIFPADRAIDGGFLRKITVDAGLKIAAYTSLFGAFIKGEADWQDKFKAELDKALILGAPVMMIPPVASPQQHSLAEDRRAWKKFYSWAAVQAASQGVKLTLESTGMLNSPVTLASEAAEILNEVPELGVTLDYGNMATGGDTAEDIRQISDRICHIHMKDWHISAEPFAGALEKRNGSYFGNALIGTGDLDLKRSWEVLSPENRECFVNLETADFSGRMTVKEALKQVSDTLRSW